MRHVKLKINANLDEYLKKLVFIVVKSNDIIDITSVICSYNFGLLEWKNEVNFRLRAILLQADITILDKNLSDEKSKTKMIGDVAVYLIA